jgi:transketolase
MTPRLGDHLGRSLAAAAERDARIWVIDGDLADSDGAIHFAERHPARFINAGIAEQAMVSLACGLATCGLRPWVFSFAAFLCSRAYDQIRVGLCHARQPVVLVGSHSGGCAGRNGKSHACLNDLALMASLPGLQVWTPADPADARFACRALLDDAAPAYVRLPRMPLDDLPGFPSYARWLAPRRPVSLAGCGLGSRLAAAALRLIADADGVELGLLHVLRPSPCPPDLPALLDGVTTLFVVEDHHEFGGLASLLQQLALPVRIVPIGWPATWTGESGSDADLLRAGGLSAEAIAARITAAWPHSDAPRFHGARHALDRRQLA